MLFPPRVGILTEGMRTMCLAKSHTAAKVALDLTLRWVNGSDTGCSFQSPGLLLVPQNLLVKEGNSNGEKASHSVVHVCAFIPAVNADDRAGCTNEGRKRVPLGGGRHQE